MRKPALLSALVLLAAASIAWAEQRRLERARELTQSLVARPSALDKTFAAFDLDALAPEAGDAVLEQVVTGRLGPDALVATTHRLGELGTVKSLPQLQVLLEDENRSLPVRTSALLAAAKMLTPDSSRVLQKAASGPPSIIARVALVLLGKIEDPATGSIAEKVLARKGDPEGRAYAFRAVGHAKDARFIPQCLAALDDADAGVRIQAARALGRMGTPAVADKLEKVLPKLRDDADRFMIAEALARLGRPKGLEAVIGYLEHQDPVYRLAAATALFDVASPKSLPAIRRVLAERLDTKQKVSGFESMLIATLGALADKDAVPLLAQALRTTNVDLKRDAASALGQIGDKQGVEPLLGALRGDKRVHATALVALAELGDKRAWSAPVAAALRDRDPMIRYAATVALDLASEKGAIEQLAPLVNDAHEFVALSARTAIARLEGDPLPQAAATRDTLFLDRIRGVEREVVFKLQALDLWRSLFHAATQADIKTASYVDIVDT